MKCTYFNCNCWKIIDQNDRSHAIDISKITKVVLKKRKIDPFNRKKLNKKINNQESLFSNGKRSYQPIFRNFHFYAFYGHFKIFSLYNTSKFLFSSYQSQLSSTDMIFGFIGPFTIRKQRLFGEYFLNITLVIIDISMACDLSFQAIFSPRNCCGNKYSGSTHGPRGIIFFFFFSIFMEPMKGDW